MQCKNPGAGPLVKREHFPFFIPAFLLFLICLPFFAPAQDAKIAPDSQSQDKLKIAILLPNDTPFWMRVLSMTEQAAEDLDVELIVYSFNLSPEKMRQMTREALDSDIDGLIFQAWGDAEKEVLALAEERKVPSILINNRMPDSTLKPRKQFKYWLGSITADDYSIGERLISGLSRFTHIHRTVDSHNVLAIAGEPGDPSSTRRLAGLQAYADRHPEIQQIRVEYAYWSEAEAGEIFEKAWMDNPDITEVWCVSDLIAKGVADKIAEMGIADPPAVGGVDWDTPTADYLESGQIVVSIGGHFMDGAWAVVMLHDYLNGVDFDSQRIEFDSLMITATPDDLTRYLPFFQLQPDGIHFDGRSLIRNPRLISHDFTLSEILNTDAVSEPLRLTEQEKAWLAANPVINVAGETNNVPFNYTDESNNSTGFAIELLRYVASQTGSQMNIIRSDSAEYLKEATAKGQIHVMPVINPKDTRPDSLLLSGSYLSLSQYFFSRPNTAQISRLQDTGNRTLAVPEDDEILAARVALLPDLRIIEVPDLEAAIMAVSSGQADLLVSNYASVAWYLDKHFISNIKVNGLLTEYGNAELHMAAGPEAAPFMQVVNKALATMPASTRSALIYKWLRENSNDSFYAAEQISLTREERDWLKTKETIRLGDDFKTRPLSFLNKNGDFSGLSADFIRHFTRQLGIPAELKITKTGVPAEQRLKEKSLDIMPALIKPLQPSTDILYTDPYLLFPVVIATSTSQPPVNNLWQLAGKEVGIMNNHLAEKLEKEHADLTFRRFKTTGQAFSALSAGKIDAVLGNLAVISAAAADSENQSFAITGATGYADEIVIGVRSDWPELVSMLNKAIAAMDMQEREAIKNKWLRVNVEIGTDTLTIVMWALPATILACSVIFYIYLSNRRLSQAKAQISARTKELENTNQSLEDTLSELKFSQKQMLEQEKMASLGSLVAGVSHESGVDWDTPTADYLESGQIVVSIGGHFMDGAWAVVMLHDYLNGVDFDSQRIEFDSLMITATPDDLTRYLPFFQLQPDGIHFDGRSLIRNPRLISHDFTLSEILNTDAVSEPLRLTEQEKAWLAANPVINVAGETNNVPFNYTDESNNSTGFAIELLRYVASQTGSQMNIIRSDSAEYLKEATAKGQIHVMPVINPKDTRPDSLLLSGSYLSLSQYFFSRPNTAQISRLQDTGNRTLAVPEDDEILAARVALLPDLRIIEVPDLEAAIMAVSSGQADLLVSNYASVAWYLDKHFISNIKVNGLLTEYGNAELHMAAGPEAAPFMQVVNKALATMPASTRSALIYKWLRENSNDSFYAAEQISLTREERDWLKTKETIRLGDDFKTRPLSFLNKNGDFSGLSADFIRHFTRQLGIPAELKITKTGVPAEQRLKEKSLDIMPALIKPLQPSTDILYTDPYLLFPVVIATSTSQPPVNNLWQLAGKEVGIMNNHLAEKLEKEHADLTFRRFKTTGQAFSALSAGKIDAVLGNLAVISAAAADSENQSFAITGATGYADEIVIGVRSDWPELVSMLNKAIAAMDMQEREAIKNKWLRVNVEIGTDTLTIVMWALPATILACSVIFYIYLSNRRLSQAKAQISARTKELENTNQSLEDTLSELKFSQKQMLEQEKMASLGSLVAGVSHEINTPLGISVTAISHVEHLLAELEQRFDSNKVTKTFMQRFIKEAQEGSLATSLNLSRAANLVKSFKNISMDHNQDSVRTIDLDQYLNEVLTSLQPQIKKSGHEIVSGCAENIVSETRPGAIAQILTNLIMNSLTHAFSSNEKGMITLHTRQIGSTIELIYSDNGCGMNEEQLKRIFEPFFTTKLGAGGSGLGAHIIYNLVTNALQGTIKVESSPGMGAKFVICFPVRLNQTDNGGAD